jgi:hypothetical protein
LLDHRGLFLKREQTSRQSCARQTNAYRPSQPAPLAFSPHIFSRQNALRSFIQTLALMTSQKLRKFLGDPLLKPKPILRIGVSEHAIARQEIFYCHSV